jgi:N-acetylmuramoyl-L-alanine amidase
VDGCVGGRPPALEGLRREATDRPARRAGRRTNRWVAWTYRPVEGPDRGPNDHLPQLKAVTARRLDLEGTQRTVLKPPRRAAMPFLVAGLAATLAGPSAFAFLVQASAVAPGASQPAVAAGANPAVGSVAIGASTSGTLRSIGVRGQPPAVALPLAGIVIALDPGHAGGLSAHPEVMGRMAWIGNRWKACYAVGTSTRSGYPEHRFTFLVASLVKARLQALGATVFVDRANDTGIGPCVDERGRFGAKVHAQLTLSIHADGAASTNHGFFVMKPGLVPGYTDDIMARSSTLALAVRRGLLGTGLQVANYYAKNGIISRTDMGGFNLSDVPVVMVELGNMKSTVDAARMTSALGRDRYAAGLVSGIRFYLGR